MILSSGYYSSERHCEGDLLSKRHCEGDSLSKRHCVRGSLSKRHCEGVARGNLRRCILAVALFALLLCMSGCAGKASISARKGFVRNPEKVYASNEKAEIGMKLTGEASYYGPGFDGKLTASGEVFDQDDYTCAHKSLPFGTKLKVTRVDNGKSVVVRVNDRGPYVDGRIIDLSVAAGKDIGLDKVGHAQVTATVIE